MKCRGGVRNDEIHRILVFLFLTLGGSPLVHGRNLGRRRPVVPQIIREVQQDVMLASQVGNLVEQGRQRCIVHRRRVVLPEHEAEFLLAPDTNVEAIGIRDDRRFFVQSRDGAREGICLPCLEEPEDEVVEDVDERLDVVGDLVRFERA